MTLLSFAKRPIPLPENYDQTGYIARNGSAVGTLDRPQISALLLQEGVGERALLVFCDLLGLAPAHTRALAERIGRAVGVSPERVVITCTHTHCAPAAMSLLLLGECRESFVHKLEEEILLCAREAKEARAEEARLFFAKTDVFGVARNRVRLNETDVDPELTLLTLETKSRRIALVNYACHPVTKNADCRLYSRDYPGVVVDALTKDGLFDEAIFATAPCGDLNPILQDEPDHHERLHEYGKKIANGVREIVKNGSLIETEGFSLCTVRVHLPLEADHPRASLALSAERAATARVNATEPQKQKYEEANYLWARSQMRLESLGLSETAFDATVTVLSFGALRVIGVPFELFSDVGMNLKDAFAPAAVWELCGGNYGYFPSDELWDKAAYERGDAYMYYNRGGPLAKGSEARLTDAIREALGK